MNLKRLRWSAPSQDRADPALASAPTAVKSITLDAEPLVQTPHLLGSEALSDLAADCRQHAEDAVLMAVWSSVSAWWRHQTNTWGHRQASLLHSDASQRMKGAPEILPTLADEDRETWHSKANEALAAWEEAGSPGLLDHIASTRSWVAKIQSDNQEVIPHGT